MRRTASTGWAFGSYLPALMPTGSIVPAVPTRIRVSVEHRRRKAAPGIPREQSFAHPLKPRAFGKETVQGALAGTEGFEPSLLHTGFLAPTGVFGVYTRTRNLNRAPMRYVPIECPSFRAARPSFRSASCTVSVRYAKRTQQERSLPPQALPNYARDLVRGRFLRVRYSVPLRVWVASCEPPDTILPPSANWSSLPSGRSFCQHRQNDSLARAYVF